MRIINFRCYDKIADGWCYGTGITKDADVKDRYWLIFDDSSKTIIDDTNTIGQFTGLFDKNGEMIYENDIIKFNQHKKCTVGTFIAVVKFNKENASFGYDIGNDLIIPFSKWDELQEDMLNYTEVIGNIHDNSELLK